MSSKVRDKLQLTIECLSPDFKYDEERLLIEIRQRLVEEYEAINNYLQMIPHLVDKEIISVIEDIANEEKVHVGELEVVLYKLNPSELEKVKEGMEENE